MLSVNIGGISIGGSTGEGHAVSADELHRLLMITGDEVKGRVPIIAGIIRDCTRDVIAYAMAAQDAGADYLMITPVRYFKPDAEAHFAFFSEISNTIDMPIIIYNVVGSDGGHHAGMHG
ncbi:MULTISPECIES: dihydrodipicolinate synthase family protein [unclassified Paenibacillus]|uniref:dihydrodipicolinate synthase family protein n=1 Tax=unclassified Paenibacillus TaxID=185978 RepID=UPI001AE1F837|nr:MULTISPECIES: dihydrodipicolinate synthase family protein [unclassified Paenibacillus]MBP1154894.1 dihydrodipicolinate synthase/N-acetylneuraminate lyase [Paenibacillus sp. PvP091]MBP1169722.1 dihydrodipicolinate synthase/N-acetylneuraminate lyase [Paenibacillus sp. PvR098]MBP2440750.1 dihydrodipicolinate synthase/N-acetylneuraminate lyase [Paenibacillus sp. PvP052]